MYERREIKISPCFWFLSTAFILATAAFVPLSIKGYINIPTYCSEFRLNDPYISWPYKNEQVNHKVELIMFGIVTLACLLLFAIFRPSTVNQVLVNICDRMYYIIDIKFFRLLYTGYYILLGYLMTLVFLGFVKRNAGELRPCFMAVCQPNMTLISELAGEQDPYQMLWTTSVCTKADLTYFCSSYFSGHTLSAFYAATTCAILLYYMDMPSKQRLFSLRFLASILLFSSATWVALTRLQDHYHHVVDILTAAFLGVLMPIFMLYSPLRKFHEELLGEKCGEIGPLLAR